MPLNESKGNMYPFTTHTWNPIKGICSHSCFYCYMRAPKFKLQPARLVEKELKTDLGRKNFIFVGSSTDMWAQDIPNNWLERAIRHCCKYWDNEYLFQSKNPQRMLEWFTDISKPQPSKGLLLATTIESDIDHFPSPDRPGIDARYNAMVKISRAGFRTMVSIEPIMRFEISALKEMIDDINPEFVTIGADSHGHNLPEPDPEDLKTLIVELRKNYEVVLKKNLNRILKNV